jgi:flagellar basal body-associated protein FliL
MFWKLILIVLVLVSLAIAAMAIRLFFGRKGPAINRSCTGNSSQDENISGCGCGAGLCKQD